ncbi:hypothetical protein J7I98_13090 [Streptomyces sp. ISL-98]|uniref:hypothetical protein n=1 Tax=Streptomyces sp. ISL-98 TaxID=2819192 RepID=UPI001BE8E620|nr:hypothetical protein [Streptomyces sp. ISL-98]MBT2506808.1 hypothetical protein [Streptomyces sp. ISL-98]
MGSMRNPVGPLPSSIYWRRRAVALSVLALLALVILWVVMSGGGDGGKEKNTGGGATPAPSITPGPASSGPAISEDPGGRDEPGETGSDGGSSDGAGSGGGDDGGTDAGSGSDGGGSGDGSGDSGDGDGDGGDTGSGSGGGGGAAQRVQAGSSLPNCNASTIELSLRSIKNEYEPGEKPKFEVIAENRSGASCKIDFGPKTAVLTITDDDNNTVWSSKDCPEGPGSLLFRVPAHSTVTHAVEWDRKESAPQCATPPASAVGDGTYLLEMAGAKSPATFTLKKD